MLSGSQQESAECISGRGALSASRGQPSPLLTGSPKFLFFLSTWQSFSFRHPLPAPGRRKAEWRFRWRHPKNLPPSSGCRGQSRPGKEQGGQPTWMAMGTILLARFLYSKQMGAARNCRVQGSVLLASMPSSSSKSTMKMFPCCRSQEEIWLHQFQPEVDPRTRPRGRERRLQRPLASDQSSECTLLFSDSGLICIQSVQRLCWISGNVKEWQGPILHVLSLEAAWPSWKMLDDPPEWQCNKEADGVQTK